MHPRMQAPMSGRVHAGHDEECSRGESIVNRQCRSTSFPHDLTNSQRVTQLEGLRDNRPIPIT